MMHLALQHIYWNEETIDLEIRQKTAEQVAPALQCLVMTTAAEIADEYGGRVVYRDIIAEYICKLVADMLTFDDNDQEAVLRPQHITTEVFSEYLLTDSQQGKIANKVAFSPRIDVPLKAAQ